jgi:pantothenate kinase type III
MLLALDVGNSNTVLGLFQPATEGEPARMVADWRITTPYKQTADELGVLFNTLFSMRGLTPKIVDGVASPRSSRRWTPRCARSARATSRSSRSSSSPA